jgi:dTDP-4-amino-4,6-dideoxygalactose transaminase
MEPLRDEFQHAIARIFETGQFVMGPDVRELEAGIAELCGTKHAIACASGSEALLLALMAAGVGPGDEVIVPSYTFFATASAVARLGAKIVFVDIDPVTYNIDPQQVAEHVSPATKAIIPVHLFGQCADMDPIQDVARRHSLVVIEDAAQAIGAEYKGRRAGAIGDVGCFSFYPTKNLGGAGDGGMLTTNDDELAQTLALLRAHGMEPRYYHRLLGINSRLDSIQAAVLNIKLRHLEKWTQMREENARLYRELFTAAGLDTVLGLPDAVVPGRHVWNQYTVRVPGGHRDALRQHLAEHQIGTEIYYPVPVHRQECFAELGHDQDRLPETEKAAAETIALPIFPELTAAEQQTVVGQIANFCRSCRQAA